MKHFPAKKISLIILSILSGSFILCYWAFMNRYPLVYSDTGTYIGSGFENYYPVDRPIFYGLFIRHISLHASLFLVVFVQGLLVSFLIHLLFREFARSNYIFWSQAAIILLTLFTGISFHVSQLIPDIFTPISVLCLMVLLVTKKINKTGIVGISLLFVFSNIVHNSNSIINAVILFLFLPYYIFNKRLKEAIKWQRVLLAACVILISLFIPPSTSYFYNKRFTYSEATFMFRISRLIEMGILQKYLNENCNDDKYSLCYYAKNDPGKFWGFMWDPESPANKNGGWFAHKAEYESLMNEILSRPKYLKIFIIKSIEGTFEQFFSFSTGDARPYGIDSPPGTAVQRHFQTDINQFISSRQNTGDLDFKYLNQYQLIAVMISMLFLFAAVILQLPNQKLLFLLLFIMVMALLVNAAVCGVLSSVIDRYQSRVIWLLPLIAMLFISDIFTRQNVQKWN
jgi:hypothetical protein